VAERRSLPLVNTEVFIESVRDSGYKSTATAIDEFIDNAREADASRVDVVLGYAPDAASTSRLDKGGMIAVADDGHGMYPDVIRLAVMWGGTHRHGSRTGYGRYGFGFPSAAASIARRFTVYSRVEGGAWHRVEVDIEKVARHEWTTKDGLVETPQAEQAEPPKWVTDVTGPLTHGTVIVLNRLDRLSPGFVQSAAFRKNLLNHLGLIYRGVLREMEIAFTDTAKGKSTRVAPVDPLFLTPGARFYDENEVHAEELPEARFIVPAHEGRPQGAVRVRYSYMPPGFQGENQAEAMNSARYRVMKENNGIIVNRAGRQIDVVTSVPSDYGLTIGQVYDRNWGVEIDFEPTLDEEFGITVNKQQATLSERMWDLLDDNGILAAIREMKRRYTDDVATRKAARDAARRAEWERKTSELVAAKAAKFKTRKPEFDGPVDDDLEPADNGADGAPPTLPEEQLRAEAEAQARATGRDPREILDEMLHGGGTYYVHYEHLPGAPPFRPRRFGGQVQLCVNTGHRFFKDVYAADWLSTQARTALEVFLFALVDSELDAQPHSDRRRFYEAERNAWGQRLSTMLDILDDEDPAVDAASAEAAAKEFRT
jgi:hypothetical protein